MRVLFGKDIVSRYYELLHYIVSDNQILSRYLAEKLDLDFTLSLEEIYFLVLDKLDELDPLDSNIEVEEFSGLSSVAKTIYLKDYLDRRKKKKIN